MGEKEVDADDDGDEGMDNADPAYNDGGLEAGLFVGIFGWVGGRWCRSWEIDEEQEEAAISQSAFDSKSESTGRNIHNSETRPLHANLQDAQETCEARKAIDVTATGHVLPAAGQREDVGELACS